MSIALLPASSVPSVCAGCGKEENIKLSTCSRCGSQKYCSKECQRKAYAEHKQSCMENAEKRKLWLKKWKEAVCMYYTGTFIFRESQRTDIAIECMTAALNGSLKLNEKGAWVARRAVFLGCVYSDLAHASSGFDEDLQRKKYVEMSESFLRIAIEASPKDARQAYVELMLNLEQKQEYAEARKLVEHAIKAQVPELGWTTPWQRPSSCYGNLRAKAFWPEDEFASWAPQLEAASATILGELTALMANGSWPHVGDSERSLSNEDGSALRCGSWKEWVLFGSNSKPEGAPKTCALLEKLLPTAVELAREGAGEIIFSRLAPNSHIIPHCASTNSRLTAHLGLIIPKSETDVDLPNMTVKSDGCAIRVGNEWRSWEYGKILFFDDSFEHEVVNNCKEERVVLLIRFYHPDLQESEYQAAVMKTTEGSALQLLARSVPPMAPPRPAFSNLHHHLIFGCINCSCPDVSLDCDAILAAEDKKQLVAICSMCKYKLEDSFC
mmetsp:Transcript_20424/g.40176  ORF Transcript_20424/g.40176 Transcript_20424/m.40176 type:complete len:496 (-) Transcript_20424:86-1573(-)